MADPPDDAEGDHDFRSMLTECHSSLNSAMEDAMNSAIPQAAEEEGGATSSVPPDELEQVCSSERAAT